MGKGSTLPENSVGQCGTKGRADIFMHQLLSVNVLGLPGWEGHLCLEKYFQTGANQRVAYALFRSHWLSVDR